MRLGAETNARKRLDIDGAALAASWRRLYREAMDAIIAGRAVLGCGSTASTDRRHSHDLEAAKAFAMATAFIARDFLDLADQLGS